MGPPLGVRSTEAGMYPRRQGRIRRARNAIDRFILARLDREGLSRRRGAKGASHPPGVARPHRPSADLGRGRRVRPRHGPRRLRTPVARLLDSPRYGERMATDWLDLARYADTHGYQMDRYRPMWPCATGSSAPSTRTTVRRVRRPGSSRGTSSPTPPRTSAGDRLQPPPYAERGGGIVAEEFRVAYVVDRVNTDGHRLPRSDLRMRRACHDHKYDPITQRDFYALSSFFQNIDESGQTSYFTAAMPVPTMLLSDDATDAKLADLDRRIAAKEAELPRIRAQASGAFEAWLAAGPSEASFPGPIGAFNFDEIREGKVANQADAAKPGVAVEGPKLVAGKNGQAADLDGEDGFTFPGLGHFTAGRPVLVRSLASRRDSFTQGRRAPP